MPKVDMIARLIRYVGSKDYLNARKIIEIMIDNEKKANRLGAARTLESALRYWPNGMQLNELPSSIKQFVWSDNKKYKLTDLYLDERVNEAINNFLQERFLYDSIHDSGLPVNHSILLAGPPGNGKTSLASAIANQLNLQMVSVKMHSIIDSLMGASEKNIGKIFEHAMMNKCLLFIDEFDTVGSLRQGGASGSDRAFNGIVTTLLTNIDRLPDTTILVAATNLVKFIDPAIIRRFDTKIWLGNPTVNQIEKYIEEYQQKNDILIGDPTILASKMEDYSWSSVEQTCIKLHKGQIIGTNEGCSEWYGIPCLS